MQCYDTLLNIQVRRKIEGLLAVYSIHTLFVFQLQPSLLKKELQKRQKLQLEEHLQDVLCARTWWRGTKI
jgi:hypothetical protein